MGKVRACQKCRDQCLHTGWKCLFINRAELPLHLLLVHFFYLPGMWFQQFADLFWDPVG